MQVPIAYTYTYLPPSSHYEGVYMRPPAPQATEVFTVTLPDRDLECQLDSLGTPQVVYKESARSKTHYRTLISLLQDVPSLTEPTRLQDLVKIANFLFKGVEYQVIDDPDKYKTSYRQQIEDEKDNLDLPPYSLIHYGVFNVDEICSPYILNNQLIFYAKKKIPYRVTCQFPIQSEYPNVRYELLPYSENS